MFRDRVETALNALEGGATVDFVEGRLLDAKADPSREHRDQRPTKAGVGQHEPTARLVGDVAACLANAGGGLILLGINDKLTGESRFEGTPADADWLCDRIVALTDPPLRVEPIEARRHGVRLVALDIPTAGEEPIRGPDRKRKKGSAQHLRIRDGRSCRDLKFTEWARLLEQRRAAAVDWSVGPSMHSPDDVDPATLQRVRTLAAASRDPAVRDAADRLPGDLLGALGLTGQGRQLNRAGQLLLIDATPAGLDYYFTDRSDGHPIDRVVGAGPLLHLLERVHERMEIHNPAVSIEGGFSVSIDRAFGVTALREIVVNAVMHRDYHASDGRILVAQRPDRVEVTSEGILPADVESRLLTASHARNPALAAALRGLGFADLVGRGVDEMYVQSLRRGHRRPAIESVGSVTRAILVGGPPDPVLAPIVAGIVDELTDVTVQAALLTVIDLLRETPFATESQLTKRLGRAPTDVEYLTEAWARLEYGGAPVIVELDVPPTAIEPAWTLGRPLLTAVSEALRWEPSTLIGAEGHLEEFAQWAGMIRRRDVLSMYDVDEQAPTRAFSAMRQAGLLEVGVAAGRNAHCVPAP